MKQKYFSSLCTKNKFMRRDESFVLENQQLDGYPEQNQPKPELHQKPEMNQNSKLFQNRTSGPCINARGLTDTACCPLHKYIKHKLQVIEHSGMGWWGRAKRIEYC